jgi:hypothetical protein
MTRLQQFCRALLDLRADALDELDDREFAVLVDVACNVWGRDAGRLFVGALLRAERGWEQAA